MKHVWWWLGMFGLGGLLGPACTVRDVTFDPTLQEPGTAQGTGGSAPVCSNPDKNVIPMDASGWVARECNNWGIQGPWYWFKDKGRTVLTNVTQGPPFVPGQGMCLVGSSPGGAADAYATWGAGIGLNLNQAPGSTDAPRLPNAPRCYSMNITGRLSPQGVRAKLAGDQPAEGFELPGKDLVLGMNEVCVDTVAQPSWCGSNSIVCLDASSLAQGISTVQVDVLVGDNGGDIDFCLSSLVPHN
jgi:hypothetical protein